jgi:hypothetical protein
VGAHRFQCCCCISPLNAERTAASTSWSPRRDAARELRRRAVDNLAASGGFSQLSHHAVLSQRILLE